MLQLSACQTFEQFMEMRHSSHNLLIKPFGRVACQEMERHLGIPWHKEFIRYHPEGSAVAMKGWRPSWNEKFPGSPATRVAWIVSLSGGGV